MSLRDMLMHEYHGESSRIVLILCPINRVPVIGSPQAYDFFFIRFSVLFFWYSIFYPSLPFCILAVPLFPLPQCILFCYSPILLALFYHAFLESPHFHCPLLIDHYGHAKWNRHIQKYRDNTTSERKHGTFFFGSSGAWLPHSEWLFHPFATNFIFINR